MRSRRAYMALPVLVLAVILQTTLFSEIRPFGVAPDLVLLSVIAVSLCLRADQAVLAGFTAGLAIDILGESLLGSWALVLTVVAYLTVRLRARSEGNALMVAAGILVLTAGGETLFAVVGTLFGQRTLSDAGVMRTILLASVYNLILAAAVVPLTARLLQPDRAVGTWA